MIDKVESAEVSIGVALTKKVKLGAGYTYIYDYNTSAPISQGGYIGCSYKQFSGKYDNDYIVSFGFEGYAIVGGGASVNINLSEAGRKIFG